MADVKTGKVKWFNSSKGYGFIAQSDDEKDIFVHHTNIVMEGYKTLSEDQEVDYEIGESDRGPVATNVVPK
tara:strand:+ start:330 stop:542 length:213 start_codon:yes stop_codon:yes gene_type:complete